MSDHKGWEETARYWTEIYANGSESARPPEASASSSRRAGKGADGAVVEEEQDEAIKAGLKVEHVDQFAAMVGSKGVQAAAACMLTLYSSSLICRALRGQRSSRCSGGSTTAVQSERGRLPSPSPTC